jgi:hypothetical protein
METQQDYKELFELLNANAVSYVIVGAHALAFHGVPRYTGDVDILVQPAAGNAARVVKALKAFGFGALGLSVDDFTKDHVVQLGVPPVRVDFMTAIEGISWAEALASRVAGKYGEVPIWYLGREALIKNKKATGRLQDLADVEALNKLPS